MNVEREHFGAVERPCAAAAEDGELVAGLVNGAIPVDALRNRQRGSTRAGSGDEFRRGTRAEAGKMRGIVPGRENLQNAQTILAVRDKRECAGGDHADFYVVDVVELAFGG